MRFAWHESMQCQVQSIALNKKCIPGFLDRFRVTLNRFHVT
jgi:hypothetical protein